MKIKVVRGNFHAIECDILQTIKFSRHFSDRSLLKSWVRKWGNYSVEETSSLNQNARYSSHLWYA